MASLQDSDLFPVGRAGATFKTQYSDLKDSLTTDLFNNAPISPAQLSIAVDVDLGDFQDSGDQPLNWPDSTRRNYYLYADLCDPDTHELIPFGQEGYGHSASSGSILKLPHAVYARNSHCVITSSLPVSRLEHPKEIYATHPEVLEFSELKLFKGRYDEGITTTDDLWNTGTEVADPTTDHQTVKLELPLCDSYGASKDGSIGCWLDESEDGRWFFRFEFNWKTTDTFKLVLLMNHWRPEFIAGSEGSGETRFMADPQMPEIQIEPMEDY